MGLARCIPSRGAVYRVFVFFAEYKYESNLVYRVLLIRIIVFVFVEYLYVLYLVLCIVEP